jgi:hypothetical protein
MRTILPRFALLTIPLLAVLVFPTASNSSSTEGSSVSGQFEIFLEKGVKRHIEFRAVKYPDGAVSGETNFRDDGPASDAPTETDADGALKNFFLRAEFDCLVIEGNKAVLSGAVSQSSSEKYVGRRVLLVAQHNGGPEGSPTRDKLTWGIYRIPRTDWLVTDAERPEDLGGQTWIASDAERPGDEGVPSYRDNTIGCQSFPISSFSFINASQGKGSVQIKP